MIANSHHPFADVLQQTMRASPSVRNHLPFAGRRLASVVVNQRCVVPSLKHSHSVAAPTTLASWYDDSSCSWTRPFRQQPPPQQGFHTSPFPQANLQVFTTRQTKRGRSQRKHSWSIPELEQETERLIRLVPNKHPDTTSSRISDDNERGTTSIHHCYDVLEAWMEVAKNDGYGIAAARKAHQLLQALEDNLPVSDQRQGRSRDGSVLVPKTSFYNVVLQSYALCVGGLEAAQAAQSLLQHMMERVIGNTSSFPRPTTKTFNIALHAWAKSGVRNAGLEAETLLNVMQKWSGSQHVLEQQSSHRRCVDGHDEQCRINERSIGSVMDAWAKSNHPEAPERVERLLQWALEQEEKNQNAPKCVDLIVFHSVMNTWVRSKRGRQAARQVEATLEHLQRRRPELKANSRTYSLIVDGWAQCEAGERTGYSARRATVILNKMILMYREGLDVKPNTWTFTSCIAAWSRCRHVPEAASEAETLFETLIELYKQTGDRDFRPDVDVGNAVIAAWVRASDDPQAIERGQSILNKMKTFAKPNLVSYNTLLGGLAKRGHGMEALHLLDWLEHSPDLKPNIYSLNTTLDALAKDEREGSAKAAEELLGQMERSKVRPDKISYSSVINAWAASGDQNKAIRAAALVEAMIQRSDSGGGSSLKPDVHVFSTLLKACLQSSQAATTKEQSQELLSIAMKAMQRLESGAYGTPNHVSYNTYMTAINNLCTDGRDRGTHLGSAFAACAAAGYVSEAILRHSPEKTEHPREVLLHWSRNVPLHDRPSAVR